ncbi:galactose-inhibitable lectin 35 kDa subunit precursor, putative [Entamoeba invadens IP1]|uniref:Galactose-inhibitable lectin 35 kDa subunit, putative n=1 Tax=Entamoeba invadens IP1 TaxID=370355 RepID=A0A0A1U3U7_ENTIV|nr:galactose-inhibitable lectin 35 kDa subunit precursor, putative [Entamoeba invadens IP1]ELP88893.1 galactose-inhibitable lectin 35 kDa subunit precursor, putative [Entamoeba invadens IP1]|eukprot:XP_004255664.1 galactose-inhibitable lectin 35 kDa subunit precursor, putative [Entamoeba invadens IP1]
MYELIIPFFQKNKIYHIPKTVLLYMIELFDQLHSNMMILLPLLIFNVFALVDEKQVVEEIIDRDKCETCCRVLFALEYDPNTGNKIPNNSQKQYVMDVEFDTVSMIRIDINADNVQKMRVRDLQTARDLQYWEFASYQMFCLYSFPNRVMDILFNTKFQSPLIIWRRKAPLDPNTNNQRFTYIYDYSFMDKRHSPYAKAFIAEYYQKVDNCNDWWYCNEHQVNYDNYKYVGKEMCFHVLNDNAPTYCGVSYYNSYSSTCSSSYSSSLRAEDCRTSPADQFYRQKFIPIFA